MSNDEYAAEKRADAEASFAGVRCATTGKVLEPYDPGLLNDFGGGDVDWWQDYVRVQLALAHDWYAAQFFDVLVEKPALPDFDSIVSAIAPHAYNGASARLAAEAVIAALKAGPAA